MNETIKSIEKKVSNLLISLGFEPKNVNNARVYAYEDSYYKFTFIKGLGGFVVEYAETIGDAEKNLFEDCDVFLVEVGTAQLLENIEDTLKKYYIQAEDSSLILSENLTLTNLKGTILEKLNV